MIKEPRIYIGGKNSPFNECKYLKVNGTNLSPYCFIWSRGHNWYAPSLSLSPTSHSRNSIRSLLSNFIVTEPRSSFLNRLRSLYFAFVKPSCNNFSFTIIATNRGPKYILVNLMCYSFILPCPHSVVAILSSLGYY